MIFVDFLFWYYITVPKNIITAWINFLKFNLRYFSISLLLKTFICHWRQYKWDYPRGFDLYKYAEVFISNLISRILGMVMKTILIFIGLLSEIFILIIGALILITWLALPTILIICLI